MLTATEKVRTRVAYGIGEACTADLSTAEAQHLTVRDLILRVSREPQQGDPATRTARVLNEAIRTGRPLYVERLRGPACDPGSGDPLSLDQPVPLPEQEPGQQPRTLEFLTSEPFRGGRAIV